MDNRDEKDFVHVSKKFEVFMGYTKVKEAFPHIPCERDPFERIAYASGFDDSEITKLKEALAGRWGALRAVDRFFSNSLVKEIGSITCFEERELRVVEIFRSLWGSELKCELEEAGVQSVDRWWEGMENLSRHGLQERKDGFFDRMLEGMYALALQKARFDVQMNPYGDEGADLQIRYGTLSFDIEVSRFHRNKGLERKLEGLGRPEVISSEATMAGKVKDESGQLREDKNGIVLLHSENTGVDHDVFVEWRDINASCLLQKSPNLCAVIFDYNFMSHIGHMNQSARIPEDNLRPVLDRIVKALNRVKGYTVAHLRVV